MIEFIVNWAIYVLGKLGYFGVFSLMALESACIPIPSEAILPFGGYLASSAYTGNKLNLILVIIIGTLGGTFGSVFIYYIGAKGGRPLVEKYAEKLRLSKSHLEMSDNYFNKYGEKIAFFSRLLPIIRTFISLPAGISKMDFKKFVFYTFVGSLIWSIILGYAGYMMGENWTKIRSWLHIADYVVVAAVVGLIGYWIINRRKKTVTEE
jgi:membrane protein DedA with SNARE-associated domain